MSERNYYVLCDDNCRFESMTKEQIIAAIAEATGETPTHVDDAFITKIKEKNNNAALSFWVGTTAQYNAIEEKAQNCFYILTDDTSVEEMQIALAEMGQTVAGFGETVTTLNESVNYLMSEISALKEKYNYLYEEVIPPSYSGAGILIDGAENYALFDVTIQGGGRADNVPCVLRNHSGNVYTITGRLPYPDVANNRLIIHIVQLMLTKTDNKYYVTSNGSCAFAYGGGTSMSKINECQVDKIIGMR